MANPAPPTNDPGDIDWQLIFNFYNERYFKNELTGKVQVKWSASDNRDWGEEAFAFTQPRYNNRRTFITIQLNRDQLRNQIREFFIDILVHEMIHAYLMLTKTEDKHDFHGPEFVRHMKELNKKYNLSISKHPQKPNKGDQQPESTKKQRGRPKKGTEER